jgi:hypothetical protein
MKFCTELENKDDHRYQICSVLGNINMATARGFEIIPVIFNVV